VTFNGISALVTSWSATSITATVPSGATTGNVVVTVSGVQSNGLTFTLTAAVRLLVRWPACCCSLGCWSWRSTASAGARSRREKAKGTSVPTVRERQERLFRDWP